MTRLLSALLLILVVPRPSAAQAADTTFPIVRLPDRVMRELGCATGSLDPLTSPYGGALLVDSVETPPRPVEVGPARQTPEALIGRSAAIRFRFVVDTSGSIEPCSMRLVSASDERFIESAALIAREGRFAPGRNRGQKVRVIVEQNITFN